MNNLIPNVENYTPRFFNIVYKNNEIKKHDILGYSICELLYQNHHFKFCIVWENGEDERLLAYLDYLIFKGLFKPFTIFQSHKGSMLADVLESHETPLIEGNNELEDIMNIEGEFLDNWQISYNNGLLDHVKNTVEYVDYIFKLGIQ